MQGFGLIRLGETMVSTVTIYHNANCSKSQEALDYLKAHGYRPRVIEYLKTPPTEAEIRTLVRQLGIAPSSLIRSADFDRLGLAPTSDPDEIIALIAEHPVLMQRPIVVVDERARIAKPAEVLAGFLPPPDPDHSVIE